MKLLTKHKHSAWDLSSKVLKR